MLSVIVNVKSRRLVLSSPTINPSRYFSLRYFPSLKRTDNLNHTLAWKHWCDFVFCFFFFFFYIQDFWYHTVTQGSKNSILDLNKMGSGQKMFKIRLPGRWRKTRTGLWNCNMRYDDDLQLLYKKRALKYRKKTLKMCWTLTAVSKGRSVHCFGDE